VPYLDIPFQHTSDAVLKRMNRRYGRRELDRLLGRIRRILPECAVRTTLMVGFPGEKEKDIDEMIAFMRHWTLDHVGIFRYADEDGSAAFNISGKVDEETKLARYNRVMEVQAEICTSRQQRFVDTVEPVLVEGFSRESDLLLEGRTRYQAPDIDGCVYITAGTANPGDIVRVRITEAHTYDLVGEIGGAENE
jgi:ribosomal protein S12 methylthiotransferase